MRAPRDDRFHLRHHGRLIEVEVEPKFMEPRARLLIDGEVVADASTWPEQTTLQGPGVEVRVQWTVFSRPQRAWAVFDEEQNEHGEGDETEDTWPEHDLTPPPGSWAERVATFATNHPNVYASRHVIKATAQALIGLIGIGAILWGLLPRFDIPFPDISPGDWIRNLVPGWLQDLLNLPGRIIAWFFGWIADITIVERFVDWVRASTFPPDWLRSIVSNARYWVPILIAVLIAIEEVNRRGKKRDDEPPKTSANAGTGQSAADHDGNETGQPTQESTPDTPGKDDAAPGHPDDHNDTETPP